ncbi:hypothetical protein, partial [Citricoccus sp. GCM10030269]|uniref:hypothetical protein n=1 Tax=Citricoccus sp. GCM10030269 TaxID=3273388 RepID=UPI00361F86CE
MTERMRTIGLMADPGVPEMVAGSVAADVSRELSDEPGETGAMVPWEVEVSRTTLPITRLGEIPLMQQAQGIRDERGWDYVLYLADLPRAHEDQLMLCETSSAAQAALVCLPALGAFRLRARTAELLVALVRSMQQGSGEFPSAAAARHALGYGAVHRVSPGGDG